MKSSLKKQAERFLREQKNYKRWLAVFVCLAVVVTIGTTAALKYKGIAVTSDDSATEAMYMERPEGNTEEIPEGMRRHVHTEACYEEQPVLVCEAAKAEAGETAEAGTSNAGAAEESKPADTAQGHVHSDSCYEVTGGTEKLTCTKEEHTHGDGCYETKTVTKTVPETVSEEVTDEEGNTTTVEKTVEKTVEETEEVLTCAKEEHSHGASCYTVEGGERTLVCGKEEGEGAEAPAAEAAVPAAETVAPATEGASTADAEASAVTESTDTADAADATTESTVADNTETPAAEDAGAERTAAETTGVESENTETAEEVTGEHVHDESCYELQMVLICGKEEGELEEIPFEGGVQECVAGNVKVIAEYGPEAEIPANAVLQAKQITPEEDPEYYAEREAEYLEEAGEDAVLDMLLDIGFYVGDEEIEPNKDATVSITIEMLDDVYEDGEELNVIHFGSEETEKLDASEIETNEEGNKTTSFEASSFSTFAIGTGATSLEDGTEYLIYYQSYGTTYALSHKGNSLEAKTVTISNGTIVKTPEEYDKEDFLWKYEQQGNSAKYLGYVTEEGTQYRLAYSSSDWRLMNNGSSLTISNNNGFTIRTGNRNSYNYLRLQNGGIDNTNNSSYATKWTFAKMLPESYTVNYWNNEYSVTSFQENVTDKGTLVGKIVLTPEEVDGRLYITIPLTGSMPDNNGKLNEIGKLEDYVRTEDGHTYKFYGWSQVGRANYRWSASEKIYRGENIVIDDKISLPKNPADGEIRLDVTDQVDQNIDLYAIWAAPSRAEGENGVVYYGGNQTSPTRDQYGVYFFVSITGQIPNEPGSFGAGNYTDGIRAKDENGNEILNPLYYWMHIYGAGNEKAVSANLRYRPTEEDIWKAVRAKGTIAVNGNNVNFGTMSQEEFTSKYYVVWYVCKDQGNFWHVDGSLMEKGTKWNLAYDGNGADDANAVIQQRQYDYNNDAIVKNSLENGAQSDKVLIRKGYNFLGWETWTTGENGERTTITDFTCNDHITVDSEGNVYKGPDKVEGLKADQDEGGIWTVTLHAKWEKITHDYMIQKAWKDEDSVINPLIKSIKVEISRYTVDENQEPLNKDGNGNPIKETLSSIVELDSSKDWKTTVTLDDTDDAGNTYVYEMREISIDGATGEIVEAKDSYIMDYKKTTNRLYTLTNTLDQEKIIKITVKKTEQDGTTPLSDAVFKLSRKDANGNYTVISENYRSGADGIVINNGALIAGEYKLEEVAAPAGYQKNNEAIEFKVENKGTSENPDMTITTTSEAWNSRTNTFTIKNNKMTMAVKVKKVPSDNTDGGWLNGAEFVVKNSNEEYLTKAGEWSVTLTNDCKFTTEGVGIIELSELPAGEYTLEEVKAPDGYNLRGGFIPFVIRLDKTDLVLEGKTGVVYEGAEIQSTEKTIKVSNSAGIELPETGGPGTVAYTFGGLAMMIAISLMYGLSMRRKRGKGGLN